MPACIHCGADVTLGSRFCATCGQPATPSGAAPARRPSQESLTGGEQRLLETLRTATLGEYEILGELGRGGMAIVYLAFDVALERKVAIKLMSPALLLMDPAIQARFKREARTAAALSHPHIIPVFAVKESDDLVYFVMKYIEGRSLEGLLDETGPLPISVAVTILQQAGAALAYAHRKGVVHRDVKPGNIMLDEDGWVVVSDFGIAKVAQGEALTATGGVVGTPAYMSPEQCQGLDIGGATDQYALGIVAYEMIAGRAPFQGESMVNLIYDHCHTAPMAISDLRPDCPPDLAATVMRMLAKKAEDRFPTIDDAVAAVGQIEEASDEARTQLLTFVQQTPSTTEQLINKFRTPGRPMTRAQTSAPAQPTPATAAPVAVPAPAPVRRWAMIGVPTIALLATVGWFLMNRGDATDMATPADPAPATVAAPSAPATASEVEIIPMDVRLAVGAQTVLVATARDTAGAAIEAPIVWESRDPAIATVSDGAVTGIAPGAARVVARSGLSSASVTVEVTAPAPATAAPSPTRVSVDPPAMTLVAGGTVDLRGQVVDQRGRPMAGQRIEWRSTASAVATVTPSGAVRAVAPGTATIIASAAGLSGSAQIVVSAAPVAALHVTPASASVQAGGTVQLAATARDAQGATLEGRAISWSSSDPAVARISSAGVVTAVAAGSARITAASEGVTAGASVAVTAAPVAAPAPGPVADPRPLILAEVERYRQAIASMSIDRLREVDPSMSSERERAWTQFFGNVSDLTVTFDDIDLETAGTSATARVSATYEFRAGRNQTQQTSLTIQLRQAGDRWRVASVQ